MNKLCFDCSVQHVEMIFRRTEVKQFQIFHSRLTSFLRWPLFLAMCLTAAKPKDHGSS